MIKGAPGNKARAPLLFWSWYEWYINFVSSQYGKAAVTHLTAFGKFRMLISLPCKRSSKAMCEILHGGICKTRVPVSLCVDRNARTSESKAHEYKKASTDLT